MQAALNVTIFGQFYTIYTGILQQGETATVNDATVATVSKENVYTTRFKSDATESN